MHLRSLFASDPSRGERLAAEAAGLYLDSSKNRITDETLRLLVGLAEACGLRERIDAMFRGEKINTTEDRAVLHVALRAPRGESILFDGHDVVPHVHAVLDRMAAFADQVRDGRWRGHTGRRVRTVINIGIGGSDLGPVMAYEALKHYSARDLAFRFVSNVDGTDLAEATRNLDPAETLFIVSSKTFTTLETMTNARTARACASWAHVERRSREPTRQHLVPCSASHLTIAVHALEDPFMDDQITVRLPTPWGRTLRRTSRRLGRRPSQVVGMALEAFFQGAPSADSERAERVEHLIGSLSSGIPDLAERHREYVLASLKHAR